MTRERVREVVITTKAEVILHMLVGIASLPLESRDAFLADPRMVAAGESYLRRALEALMDLGRHILAKQFGVAAVEYEAVAQRLGEEGVLASELAERMQRMAGYRNRMVHAYEAVWTPSSTKSSPGTSRTSAPCSRRSSRGWRSGRGRGWTSSEPLQALSRGPTAPALSL